jgi:NADH-quinone oxidoreductase subunit G
MSLEKMITIHVDGKAYDVRPEKNLLETCLSLGLDIPHFCNHPALGSVGACRLCAVKKFKDAEDKNGKIIMSCMEPVTDGMIISIADNEAREFRAAVIESLMLNHPHDCPVCDEGGECMLQDMTVMTGHNYRRFDFKKKTYQDQDLGPFINHEMNRCIQCYRCVRFYRDYAGGKDLNVFGAHNHVYFGRHKNGTLENEFSGNLVEVCPTGVFTDKTLKKHFTRKWDLTNTPSVCVHCSVGCNTIVSERYNTLRRTMNRYNGAVNGYFICDRGRFGYEFVNSKNQIRKIKVRLTKDEQQAEMETDQFNSTLKPFFSKKNKIIGIGSPRASSESNFALLSLVGKENFVHGISKKEQDLTKEVLDFLKHSGVNTPSLKQIEQADAVIILGEDITNTAPMIALALRQATRNLSKNAAEKINIPLWNDAPVRELAQRSKNPLFIATPFRDSLDELAEETFRASNKEIARLGFAVASALNEDATMLKVMSPGEQSLVEKIADSLIHAKYPLIISGILSGDEDMLHAAFNIALALNSRNPQTMVSLVLPECNSMGLALFPGKPLDDLLSRSADERTDTLVILENDLYRRADRRSVDLLFEKCDRIIVLDHITNKTSLHADLVIPAATFAGSQGTLVNNEGRAQRFYKVLVNDEPMKESWRWLYEMIQLKEEEDHHRWNSFDDLVRSMANEFPVFSKLTAYMPEADLRILHSKIPRQSIRYSGRTAMNAKMAVSERKTPDDNDSPLAFSMEGRQEQPPSSLVPFYWAPGWNSVQALNHYLTETNGSLKGGDPGIRLLEINKENNYPYYKNPIPSTDERKDGWTLVPVYQIFGSEELSSLGAAVSTRIPEPFVWLTQKDADIIGARNGEIIQLDIAAHSIQIKVIIENSLQQGIAGLSVFLPGMDFMDLPGHGKFSKL